MNLDLLDKMAYGMCETMFTIAHVAYRYTFFFCNPTTCVVQKLAVMSAALIGFS